MDIASSPDSREQQTLRPNLALASEVQARPPFSWRPRFSLRFLLLIVFPLAGLGALVLRDYIAISSKVSRDQAIAVRLEELEVNIRWCEWDEPATLRYLGMTHVDRHVFSVNIGGSALRQVTLPADHALRREMVSLIGRFSTLEMLELKHSDFNDEDAATLGTNLSVKTLNLSDTRTTDGGCRSLAQLRRIETLFLHKCDVTDSGIAAILSQHGAEIETLDIGSTKATGDCLKTLLQHETIESVSFSGSTHVSDDDLIYIAQLNTLRHLRLNFTSVSDASIPGLSRMTQLEELFVDNTRISEDGLKQLRNALGPQCLVHGNSRQDGQ